jgi:hypothetical protein
MKPALMKNGGSIVLTSSALPTDRPIASRSVRSAACIRRHESCDEPLVKDEGQTMQDAMRQFAIPVENSGNGATFTVTVLAGEIRVEHRAEALRPVGGRVSGLPWRRPRAEK